MRESGVLGYLELQGFLGSQVLISWRLSLTMCIVLRVRLLAERRMPVWSARSPGTLGERPPPLRPGGCDMKTNTKKNLVRAGLGVAVFVAVALSYWHGVSVGNREAVDVARQVAQTIQ